MPRIDGRANSEVRETRITPGYQPYAEGSALIEMGQTRVLCAVSVEDRVPPFRRGTGQGWITAEYGMLPRSTLTRIPREGSQGGPKGRTQEIQRLIGRSLRAAADMDALGEHTLIVDCDVLQADGGTRTAAITGGYVALYQAALNLMRRSTITTMPLKCAVAAISAGIVGEDLLLDLCYEEDFRADADFNVVMTDRGEFVEVQGTAEGRPFHRGAVDTVLALAEEGIRHLFEVQARVIRGL